MGATVEAIGARARDGAACATHVRNAAATALARMGESKESLGR